MRIRLVDPREARGRVKEIFVDALAIEPDPWLQ